MTVQVLRNHRERQLRELRELGAVDTGYVFTDATGEPLAPPRLSDTFRRLVKATGLPPVRSCIRLFSLLLSNNASARRDLPFCPVARI